MITEAIITFFSRYKLYYVISCTCIIIYNAYLLSLSLSLLNFLSSSSLKKKLTSPTMESGIIMNLLINMGRVRHYSEKTSLDHTMSSHHYLAISTLILMDLFSLNQPYFAMFILIGHMQPSDTF